MQRPIVSVTEALVKGRKVFLYLQNPSEPPNPAGPHVIATIIAYTDLGILVTVAGVVEFYPWSSIQKITLSS